MTPSEHGVVSFASASPEITLSTVPKRKPVPNSNTYQAIPQIQQSDREDPKIDQRQKSSERHGNSRTLTFLVFICDAVITILPIAFVVLAFYALVEDNKVLSPRGDTIRQAARLGPTIFPILFAAVVGRLMKSYALWRAERSATLGLLELLVGSQSISGAVQRAVLLRQLSLTSTLVVVLWGLSPLGGQSSLRVLNTKELSVFGNQSVYYFDTSNDTNSWLNGAMGGGSNLKWISSIYQACLLAPNRTLSSATDLWNNVKIPMIETLPEYDQDNTANPWVSVNSSQRLAYSSLTGLMIAGLPSERNSNFTVESNYFTLGHLNDRWFNTTGGYGGVQDWVGSLMSEEVVIGLNSAGFFINTSSNVNDNMLNIVYGSLTSGNVAAFNFSLLTSHVESQVVCEGQVCQVVGMRRSPRNLRPSNSTSFADKSVWMNLFTGFSVATGVGADGETSPTALYVAGSDTPFDPFQLASGLTIKNLTALDVSVRLATLLNTYWFSSLTVALVATEATGTTVNMTAIEKGDDLFFIAAKATANTALTQTVYAADHVWVGITAAVSIILLFCGVLGMFFKYAAVAPDILGYVSTMTRDNPYCEVEVGDYDGMLDGLERARLLKDVRLQIKDAKWWEETGHVALMTVNRRDERRQGRVVKGRNYG